MPSSSSQIIPTSAPLLIMHGALNRCHPHADTFRPHYAHLPVAGPVCALNVPRGPWTPAFLSDGFFVVRLPAWPELPITGHCRECGESIHDGHDWCSARCEGAE